MGLSLRIRFLLRVFNLVTAVTLLLPAAFQHNSDQINSLITLVTQDSSKNQAQDLVSSYNLQFTLTPESEANAEKYPWTLAGGGMLLGPGRLLYQLLEPGQRSDLASQPPSQQNELSLEVEWLGAREEASLLGIDRMLGKINYFLGDGPDDWLTGRQAYKGASIQDLYPGIDLVFDGKDGRIKSQYAVKALADPLLIRWRYSKGIQPRVDPVTGDLQVYKEDRLVLIEKAPQAWQAQGHNISLVEVKYQVAADEVSFIIGDYNPRLELIIDPWVEFSTYIGGGSFASGNRVVVDGDRYVYITGRSMDKKFYIAKLDVNTRSFVYTSFIGANLSGDIYGLAVDALGNAYIAGVVYVDTYPMQNQLQGSCPEADGFLTKLDPDGSQLLFSTYVCGNQSEAITAIHVGTDLKVHIIGTTSSTDFPVTAGAMDTTLGGTRDGFIATIDPVKPERIYSTYLGGSAEDGLNDFYFNDSGVSYILGYSNSTDYPVKNPIAPFHGGTCWYGVCNDAVYTKFDHNSKTILYSSYLGGSGSDIGSRITVDNAGNVYIAGETDSNDIPLVNPIQNINYQGGAASWGGEIFLMILNPGGTTIFYSTYLGGPGEDQAMDIAVINSSHAFALIGTTATCIPPFNYKRAPNTISFIMFFDPAGLPTYFYLPSGYSFNTPGSLAVDANANVYAVGNTTAKDLPLINPISTTVSYAYLVQIAQKYRPAPAWPNHIYLPLMMKTVQKAPQGIYGWVTAYGCGAPNIPLELRYFNGTSWSTRATTTTSEDGKYSFLEQPALNPGEYYYVRYVNETDPNRVWIWTTPYLTAYSTGQDLFLSTFEITDTSYETPSNGGIVPLPVQFKWGRRLFTPTDSYDFNLIEYEGTDEWWTPPLGYVGQYTLPVLPLNFVTNEWEFWYIGIHSPDGGYGEMYEGYFVKFSSSGAMAARPVTETDRLNRKDQIEEIRLQKAELKQPGP